MRVEIITTGTELFLDRISNHNLAYLSNQFIQIGCLVNFHTTVPDDLSLITQAIKTALKRVDLIIITGGLGPTEDDITRQTVAGAVHKNLYLNRQALQSIKRFFKQRGRHMLTNNEVQAYLPKGARPLINQCGTAPGFRIMCQSKTIIALPGVPQELRVMFQNEVMPRLKRQIKDSSVYSSTKLLLFGIPESHFQARLKHLSISPDVKIGITIASDGVIALRLTVKTTPHRFPENSRGSSPVVGKVTTKTKQANKMFAGTIKTIKNEFGSLIFGKDNDTLAQVVGNLLLKKKLTLAIAESCSGGLLAHKITNVPGISLVFKEGLICYSNNAKMKRLNIPRHLIRQKGAVSSEVASLMARNIRHSEKTDIGLSITGLAGPGGGTQSKPVGMVYIGLCFNLSRTGTERDSKIKVKECRFIGDRPSIKDRATAMALNMLRLSLL